jgi:hypothetical protein
MGWREIRRRARRAIALELAMLCLSLVLLATAGLIVRHFVQSVQRAHRGAK